MRILPVEGQKFTAIEGEGWYYHLQARKGKVDAYTVVLAEFVQNVLDGIMMVTPSDCFSVVTDDVCAIIFINDISAGSFIYFIIVLTEGKFESLRIQTGYMTEEQKENMTNSVIELAKTFRFDKSNRSIPKTSPLSDPNIITQLKDGNTSAFDNALEKVKEEEDFAFSGQLKLQRYRIENGFLEEDAEKAVQDVLDNSMEVIAYYCRLADKLVTQLKKSELPANTMLHVYKGLTGLKFEVGPMKIEDTLISCVVPTDVKDIRKKWEKAIEDVNKQIYRLSIIKMKEVLSDSNVINELKKYNTTEFDNALEKVTDIVDDILSVKDSEKSFREVMFDRMEVTAHYYRLADQLVTQLEKAEVPVNTMFHVYKKLTEFRFELELIPINEISANATLKSDIENIRKKWEGAMLDINKQILNISALKKKGALDEFKRIQVEYGKSLKKWEMESQKIKNMRKSYASELYDKEKNNEISNSVNKLNAQIDMLKNAQVQQQKRKETALNNIKNLGLFALQQKKEHKVIIKEVNAEIKRFNQSINTLKEKNKEEIAQIEVSFKYKMPQFEQEAKKKYPIPAMPKVTTALEFWKKHHDSCELEKLDDSQYEREALRVALYDCMVFEKKYTPYELLNELHKASFASKSITTVQSLLALMNPLLNKGLIKGVEDHTQQQKVFLKSI